MASPGISSFVVSLLAACALSPSAAAQQRFRLLEKTHCATEGAIWGEWVADFDADGRDDALVFRSEGHGIAWAEPGLQLGADATLGTGGRGRAVDAAVVDLDGDGLEDVYLLTSSAAVAWFNQGQRRFRPDDTTTPMPRTGSNRVHASDVDGDGDADLLISAGSIHELYLNDGTGRFTPAPSGGLPAIRGRIEADVDVDADGDRDLLLLPFAVSDSLTVLVNDGSGGFADESATRLPALAGDLRCLGVGDFDADRSVDLLLGRSPLVGPQRRPSTLLLNDGTGHFVDRSDRLPLVVHDVSSFAVADLDGDGDLDAASANGEEAPTWLRNDGSARFVERSLPPGQGRSVLFAAIDLAGDGGTPELVHATQTVGVLLNDGQGGFLDGSERRFPSAPFYVESVRFADLEGDGDLDVLLARRRVSTSDVPEVRLYRNDGSGRFTDVSSSALPADARGSFVGDLVFADLDADRDPDIFRAGGASVWINDGRGVFRDETTTRVPAALRRNYGAVGAADLDGDGAAEIILDGSTNLYLANDGNGHFSDASSRWTVPVDGFPPEVVHDLDGDGDVDLLVGWPQLNDRGFLRPIPEAWYPRQGRTSATLGADLDGDGDVDAVVAPEDGPVRWLANDGTGRFTLVAEIAGTVARTGFLRAADVDDDGDLDLLAAARGTPPVLLINDGSGGLLLEPLTVASIGTAFDVQAIDLVDVDGDDRPDLWSFYRVEQEVRSNRGGLLWTDRVPRPGTVWPLELEAHSAPGGLAVTVLSPGRGQVDLGGLGTLWIDLGRPLPLPTVQLAVDGRATLSVPIPNDAALSGVGLFGQTLFVPVATSARLGNLLVETIL